MKKLNLLLALGFLMFSVANAEESLNMHLKLVRITDAAPPEVFEKTVLFTLGIPARSAGVVFEHEDYTVVHPFVRARSGVLILAYPIPTDPSVTRLKYRFVVDGAWIRDPNNPRFETDDSGVPLSVFALPARDPYTPERKMLEGRTAHFIFKALSGETVTVEGSFNGWDPFMYEMEETSAGIYELAVPLTPGRHYYAFVRRGQRFLDTLNPEKAYSRAAGQEASVLEVR
jgi:hypothetical protein